MPSPFNESPPTIEIVEHIPSPYFLSDDPPHAIDDGIQERSSNLEDKEDMDGNSELKNLRLKNVGRLVIGYLNINSVRNKFEGLKDFVSDNIDILIVAETKIDNSFPKGQFFIQGYSEPFRLDRNSNGGGLLVFVKEDIPSKQLKSFKFEDDIECIGFEINLRKKKWALFSIYRPPTQSQPYFFSQLSTAIDHYSDKYENFVVLGDFNAIETEQEIGDFMDLFALKNLVKEPTCFKSGNPRCIDLILTNRGRNFQHTTAIETGLSDFHKMIVTVLKASFDKQKPNVVNYRDYKHFREDIFRQDLQTELADLEVQHLTYTSFQDTFQRVLDKHAPMKKRYIRANDSPFMNRTLHKAFMLRTRLKNKYNKNRTADNWDAFRRQRNLCVKLSRQAKRCFYNQLDISEITDNKKFWKTVKPFISDKSSSKSRITLIEEGKIVSNESEVAETFNNFFVTITESLGIIENENIILDPEGISDPIEQILFRFSRHPSIQKIRSLNGDTGSFSFKKVSVDNMKNEIDELNPSKSTTFKSIPPKLLKNESDLVSTPLQIIFNNSVEQSSFPDELKLADVSSLFKKEVKTFKGNYRPISVLPTVSKVFERLMATQIFAHMSPYLSWLLCGFRKGYNAQHALMRAIEKWKTCLDNGGKIGAIFMDLSKAFDCIRHDLLIAKLHAYGFSREALWLAYSYLENRQQRVKINGSFSTYKHLRFGVPQGSVLGPLFFNIYINDLLLSIQETDICNYADDTTIYTCDMRLENVISRLENDSKIIIEWFGNNYMKLNEDKCHFMIFGERTNQEVNINIGSCAVTNSKEEKLLGVLIDANLSFEKHISNICQKAGNKLFALSRMSAYLGTDKLRLLMRAFVTSQFQYCPLVWMFHSRKMNNKINRLHERALRIAYKDYSSSFATLLEKDRSVTVHEKNMQLLMTEMFKTINNLNPPFMNEIFLQRSSAYNLRNINTFMVPKVNTVNHGTETVQYRGQRIWQSVPQEIKDANSVQQFKNKIKFWKNVDCDCRLCKRYIPGLGFL